MKRKTLSNYYKLCKIVYLAEKKRIDSWQKILYVSVEFELSFYS